MLLATVRYGTDSIISACDATDSMTRAVQINLKQRINSAFKNEQIVISSNGCTRTCLSATLTQISYFVGENVSFFTSSRLPVLVHAQHVKYANRNALSMFKALNK